MSMLRSLTTSPLTPPLPLTSPIAKTKMRHTMKPPRRESAGFSLVEVALALGVAAVCLLVLMGLLPTGIKTQQSSTQQTRANQIISAICAVLSAEIRLPPGQANKVCPDPPDPNLPCNWGGLA